LREELQLFFKDNNKESFPNLQDTNWLLKVAYLADVYQRLNALNTSMQGQREKYFDLHRQTSCIQE
jgi:hypothetical protein